MMLKGVLNLIDKLQVSINFPFGKDYTELNRDISQQEAYYPLSLNIHHARPTADHVSRLMLQCARLLMMLG